MADLDKIKAKLKALRAKTVDNGRTEEEALLAAEKMTEMLSKYGISAEELDAVDYGKNAVRLGRRSPLDDIWSAVARFADCKGWYERDGGKLDFVFFGRVQDTLVAEYVYEVLKSACAKALADFRTTDLYLRRRTTKTRARAVRSFQEGLAGRLCAKLREGLWRRYWAGSILMASRYGRAGRSNRRRGVSPKMHRSMVVAPPTLSMSKPVSPMPANRSRGCFDANCSSFHL